MDKQMNKMNNNNWLDNEDDMLRSLLGDEAKNKKILDEMANTIYQLRAKSSFRLALLNQLMDARGINTNTINKLERN